MSSTGKIARLPDNIRTQLNLRLLDGEAAEPILKWLNADPAVQEILNDQFAGHPLTPQNLSEWRTGAFADWQLRQEVFGKGRQMHESAGELQKDMPQGLAESLATVLTAYYAAFLNDWNGEVSDAFNQKLRALSRLNRDITSFRKADLAIAKFQLQQDQFEAAREKTEAEQQEVFKQWLKRPDVRQLALDLEMSAQERDRRIEKLFPSKTPPPTDRPLSDQIAPTTAVPSVVSVPLVPSVPSVPLVASVPSPDPQSNQIAPPPPENPTSLTTDTVPATSPVPAAQPVPPAPKPRKDPVAEALAAYHKKRYADMEAEFARRPPARLIPLDPPECHHSRRILG